MGLRGLFCLVRVFGDFFICHFVYFGMSDDGKIFVCWLLSSDSISLVSYK